jgi:hypothetical protein
MATSLEALAELVRSALDGGDLDAYQDLLAPNAHWGPPDEPAWGCHNRNEILAWYKAAQANGMQAEVNEVAVGTNALLVGLTMWGNAAEQGSEGSAPRWQVLTVEAGKIVDICGFDNRPEAAARAGAGT